jgi:hypothetical protein
MFCRLLLLWTVTLPGQDLQLSGILPYAAEDSLRVDFSLQQLWEGKVAKTLLAGIPVDIQLGISLLNPEQQVISQRSVAGQIVYDVWEEKFTLQDLGISPSSFSRFADLKNWFDLIERVGLSPLETLVPEVKYQVRIDFSVWLLNKKQNQELKRWMQSADQTEEEFASRERSTGFRLNINQLVQLFFSGDEEPEKFQVSGSSAPFTLTELMIK